jgi:hypothetical protein
MPADLSQRCPDPGLSLDQDAFVALGRHRAALADCDQRLAGAVRFYEDVRKGLR